MLMPTPMKTVHTLKSRFILFIQVMLIASSVFANESRAQNKTTLIQKYEKIRAELANTTFGVPIHIETFSPHRKIHCHVYGIIDQKFQPFSSVMLNPKNWCEILLLHTNIKSSVMKTDKNNGVSLTIYCGRKFYQPPEDTYSLDLKYDVLDEKRDYFHLRLSGEKGPFHTRNYRINLDAAPLSEQQSVIHLSYEYDSGITMKNALKLYYATLGRKKVGFSVVGRNKQGNPIFVKGNQGLIERNSVRFYFAIQAFMETYGFQDDVRFNKRIHRWYDLVRQCPRQLYELPEKEYIENKINEKRNQNRLQQEFFEIIVSHENSR